MTSERFGIADAVIRERNVQRYPGAYPKEMAELMGHSSVQITLDRYSHVMPRMTSALADRMDSAYRDAGPVENADDERDAVVVGLR